MRFSAINALADQLSVVAAYTCAFWFVVGFFHWLGLLFKPKETAIVFADLTTSRVFALPTVGIIGTAFIVGGIDELSTRWKPAKTRTTNGISSMVVGFCIICLGILSRKGD